MKKRIANLSKTAENIAEQYPNIIEGVQKDAIQNSWDARITRKGHNWKIIFQYLTKINSLLIEDFGTTGMNEKNWEAYQGHWFTTKFLGDAGARGQGKSMFHYLSSQKLVLTETIDGKGVYRFSYGTDAEYDEDKNLSEFVKGLQPLNHQGTRIIILDVKKELLEELLNVRSFISYIASTWWEIIRDWDAEIIVNLDGVDRKVVKEEFPSVQDKIILKNIKIENFGEVKNFEIRFHKDEVSEMYRGISIQRAGMSIIRLQPSGVSEEIKNKICGYCNFGESLEEELKNAENPNHFGFRNVKVWNHIKDFILVKLDEFVQKISPKKSEIQVKIQIVNEAIKAINNLVRQYAPDLLETEKTLGGVTEGGISPPPKPLIRIDSFFGDQRVLKFDQSLRVTCEIVNETENSEDLELTFIVKNKKGNVKVKERFEFSLDSFKRTKIHIPLIDFNEGSDEKGEYIAKGVLSDKLGSEIHTRSFTFYLEQEPPLSKGKGFIKQIKYVYGRGQVFEKWRNLPITDGVLRVVWDHPDFLRIREKSKPRTKGKEIYLYSVQRGLDEAIKLLLVKNYKNEELTEELIKEVLRKRDEMYYDSVGLT